MIGGLIVERLLFVFNPYAGKAKIRLRLYEIVKFYTDHGYLVSIYPTNSSGDAYACMRNLTDEYSLIVCSGGDGTLNEIVSGMLDARRKTVLGYIPSGSTNDFGRSVGIPLNLMSALEISCCGKPFQLDIGRINDRYFVYVAGFGAFTKVSYITPQKMKNALGNLAYLLLGIKELSELHVYEMSIKYDGCNISGQFIVGLIMNSFSIAGFRNPISVMTNLNDGLFEVMLIKRPQNILELQEIVAVLLGNLLNSKHIICFQASYIEIQSDPLEWVVDGEYGGQYKHVVIENQNQAITMFIS